MKTIADLNWHEVPGGQTAHRLWVVRDALEKGVHVRQIDGAWVRWVRVPVDRDTMRLEVCADERTGRRYGNAKKRKNKCVKLGNGGRNKGSRVRPYQVWLVWD